MTDVQFIGEEIQRCTTCMSRLRTSSNKHTNKPDTKYTEYTDKTATDMAMAYLTRGKTQNQSRQTVSHLLAGPEFETIKNF